MNGTLETNTKFTFIHEETCGHNMYVKQTVKGTPRYFECIKYINFNAAPPSQYTICPLSGGGDGTQIDCLERILGDFHHIEL
ncbi:hypothetical protein MIDIC_500008 [Alphaproteobacteria bacterium]